MDWPSVTGLSQKKKKIVFVAVAALLVLVIVAIIGAYSWNHQDWGAYCSKTYPGSVYNSTTNNCETDSGRVTVTTRETIAPYVEILDKDISCSYETFYIEGRLKNNLDFPVTAVVDGASYDGSNVKLGTGFDYVDLDSHGISKYKIIILDGCPDRSGSYRVWVEGVRD
jgi:hypothetical protein